MNERPNEQDGWAVGAFAGLRTAVRDGVSPPPASEVRDRAERQRRARQLGTALVAAAAVVAVALGVTTAVRDSAAPILPPGDPSRTTESADPRPDLPVPSRPTTRVDDPIARVDWANVTLTVPPREDCPSGRLRFRDGATAGYPRMDLQLTGARRPIYGDLTRDGRPEAVVEAYCAADEETDHVNSQLLVVTRGATGELTSLGWVGPVGWGVYYGFWFPEATDDRLVVEPEPLQTAGWAYPIGTTLTYKWSGRGFDHIDTGRGIQPAADAPAGPSIDLGPAGDHVARTLGCPGGPIRITGDRASVEATAGDVVYLFHQPQGARHVLDLNRGPVRHVVVAVACLDRNLYTPEVGVEPSAVRGQGVLVLEYTEQGGFRAVDLVPVPADHVLAPWAFEDGRLTVASFRAAEGTEAPTESWVWNGEYFQRAG